MTRLEELEQQAEAQLKKIQWMEKQRLCAATIEAEKEVLADIDVEIALANLDEPPSEDVLTQRKKEELKHAADELRAQANVSRAMRNFFGKDS